MTYLPDLSPYDYLDEDQPEAHPAGSVPPRLNVGWLEPGHPVPTGPVPPGLVDALRRLARTHRAQQTRGHHLCGLCGRTRRVPPRLLGGGGHEPPRGSAEIRVAGEGVVHAAPELVWHYVAHHGYRPPEGFVAAVLRAAAPPGEE